MVRTYGLLSLAALAAVTLANPASAAGNLVTNGGFETTTLSSSGQVNATNVTGWSVVNGYTFLYLPQAGTTSGTSADNAGAAGQYGTVKLWGPGDAGGANGLTNSPAGNNFIAQDDNFQPAAITQNVGGLTIGANYVLSFYWAGAQQTGYTGSTQDQWTVNFGSQQYQTANITVPYQGFSGWSLVSTTFTATATSQVLSFLATGTPGGAPPFALLDGVSLTAAPEPATWALMLAGLGGVGFLVHRRRSRGEGASFA